MDARVKPPGALKGKTSPQRRKEPTTSILSAPSVPPPAPSPVPVRAATLVLGLGNDILTDDAIGLHVVRRLAPALAGQPALAFEETSEMGLVLLELMTGYAAVVLVDAIQTGRAAPGFVHQLDVAAFTSLTGRTPHCLGVGETLALGRLLGVPMPDRVSICAIEVADPCTLGTALTPQLETALPAILETVRAVVLAQVNSP